PVFVFSGRRRHTSFSRDWSSDVCSSDLDMKVWPRPRSRLSETEAQATNAGDPPVPEAHAVIVINRDPNAEDKDKIIYEVAVEEDGSYQKLPISQGQEDLSVRLLTNIFGEQFPYSAGPLDDVRFT